MPKRYYIITYGCQMNKSDSERIATFLEKIGYKPLKTSLSTEVLAEVDLLVVNMCSVRQSAVERVYGLSGKFKKIKQKNKKLKTILTGCILQTDRKKLSKIFDLILDIKDLTNWPKHLKSLIAIKKRRLPLFYNKCYFNVEPNYQNNSLAYIPISNGCNFNCTYCVVPFTRGKITYRNHKEILKEVKRAILYDFKEIWLLGQIVNNYISPQNKKINFAKLLKMIVKIPGDFKIFFTSPHPSFFSNELIEIMANSKKIAKYLNLPVQSGDNEILKKMGRTYTVEQYKTLVKKIRQKIPNIYLSTDIIVGFPGETKKRFENTVKLVKEIKFNNLYIGKYSPRPGTLAAEKMKDTISITEKKRRERILRELIKPNKRCGLKK